VDLAYLPSPSEGVIHLGPFPLRAYALFIIIGVLLCIWIGDKRWVARGGRPGTVGDLAVLAVPFGIIGGRLYHVLTTPEPYEDHPLRVFEVWKGGLGIWGAISLGALGAWLLARRRKMSFGAFADAIAPGLLVAQGIGRLGNYFNQELFGKPTTLPWGLEIDDDNPAAVPGADAYHPTFLYELIWDLGLAGVLVWVDRRFQLGRGRVFCLYVAGYCLGRVWIEALRIDTAEHFLGLRLNIFTSIILGVAAVVLFFLRRGPRETVVEEWDDAEVTDGPDAGAEAAIGAGSDPEAQDGASPDSEGDPGPGAGLDPSSDADSDADRPAL
jgi:prolipoprotein diacylglyceryl transferase